MFRAFFIFDAPAIVLATEARLGFFLGIFHFQALLSLNLKLISQGKRVPWERACTVYTRPQDHLRFRDGGGVDSDSLVIVGREMIDDFPDTRTARMARWLADPGKAVRNYSVCMGIRWQITFPKLNFTQFMNRSIKILSRRLYSPSLKNVGQIEDAQLIFLIFHTFVCNFFFPHHPFYPGKFTDK